MYGDEINRISDASVVKKNFFDKNPLGYIVASMLAGLFVGMAIMLIFTIGGYLSAANSPFTKIIMGASFGAALSLVIMCGSELFTGNTLVMPIGVLKKKVSSVDLLKIWVFSYIGNLMGALIGAYMFFQSGLGSGSTGEYIVSSTAAKMTGSAQDLFFKGILCNIMVCLAVWCSFKLKEEVAKLIIIFWCLYIFITSGFEHSIANMTLMAIGLLIGGNPDVTMMGYVHNLTWVTLGNIVGGVLFVALPYYFISKEKKTIV